MARPTITIKNQRNHRVSIAGLTYGDLRLLAWAVEEGSYMGGDKGGPVSQSLLRLAQALRTPGMHENMPFTMTLSSGRTDAGDNYHEVENRPELFD